MRCRGIAALGPLPAGNWERRGHTHPPTPPPKADSSLVGKDLTASSLLRLPSPEAKISQGIAQQLPQNTSWAGRELLVGSQTGLPPALVSPGGATAVPRGSLWPLSSPALQRGTSIPLLALQPQLPQLLFPSCFSQSLPSRFPQPCPVFLSCSRSPWG